MLLVHHGYYVVSLGILTEIIVFTSFPCVSRAFAVSTCSRVTSCTCPVIELSGAHCFIPEYYMCLLPTG